MAPKKKDKGGGKKAGKASKLAKMNEQERVKYLERKMAEEEELRRRKEEMVSVFLKMKLSREGRMILKDRPSINSKTVNFDLLKGLPENTLGHTYVTFCEKHKITPDSRDPVQFVDDENLAFVMKRYRETHDIVHALLDMPTDMVGESVVKWVEAMQTGLPMCIGGAIFGPARFHRNAQFVRFRKLRPWAISVGQNVKCFLNVYYEKRWEQDIDDLKYELKIEPKPR